MITITPNELMDGDVIVAVHGAPLRSPMVVERVVNRSGAVAGQATYFFFHYKNRPETVHTRYWYEATKLEVVRRPRWTSERLASDLHGWIQEYLGDAATVSLSVDGTTLSVMALDSSGANGVREFLVSVKEV